MLPPRRDSGLLIDSIPKILLWVWGSLLVGVLATIGSAFFIQHSTGVRVQVLPRLTGIERPNTRVRGGVRHRRPAENRLDLVTQGRSFLRSAAENN